MKKYQVASLMISAVLISSCATPTEYKADVAHPIRTISVDATVPVPEKMTFVGLSESMGMAFAGGIGGGLGAGTAAAFLTSRQGETAFNVGQSVRNEFIAEVQKSGKFSVKNSGAVDAQVFLKVTGYGFYQAGMFARRVRPIVGIEAKMVRPGGQVVWQHRRAVTHLTGETPAVLPEKIKADPKVGADALRTAARVCARNAVASLRQQPQYSATRSSQ